MTAPELPEPDAALLELDKLARESNCYECGLPFMASGVLYDELPLSRYYEEDQVLDRLRAVMREYGHQCFAAGMEAAANIAENTLESVSDRSSIYGTESAAAIREAAKGTSLQLIVSSAVPEDEVHLRDSAGKLIGKIVGVKP
jgi:hypothetical protein